MLRGGKKGGIVGGQEKTKKEKISIIINILKGLSSFCGQG